MKKIKKSDLKLEKVLISTLTENDLGNVKGGYPVLNTVNASCAKTKCNETQCCASIGFPDNHNPCQTNQNCLQSNTCMTNPKCQYTRFCPYTKDNNCGIL